MKIIVSTHQGILYEEEIDYVVVKSSDGEFAIMKNHIPIVSVIDEGYIKLVRENDIYFVALISGLVEFHDNIINILAQEAHIGKDVENAKQQLLSIRAERLQRNRQEQVDFTQKEKELREHLRASKAGSL